jgi:hypothetical protein
MANPIVNKNLSKTEVAVQNYLDSIGVKVSVIYCGETIRDNDWRCDAWKITLTAGKSWYTFEYYTGLGLRVDNAAAKLARNALKNASKHSIAWRDGVLNNQVPVYPAVAGLLYSVQLDAEACEQCFDAWCCELSYDTDSRKALETYLLCQFVV